MINLNVIANTFKLRYDLLNKHFLAYKGNKFRYLLVVDIGKILDILTATLTKKQLTITNSQKTKLIVALLNIISHYRHYYFSNAHCINSILLYCQDVTTYTEYKDIISDLDKIVQFVPNIILVPNISDGNEKSSFLYLHTVSYIIEHTNKITKANGQELIVNVLGHNPLEYQFITILEKVYYFFTLQTTDDKKVLNYKQLWEFTIGKDERIHNPIYQLGLKKLLVPFCLINKKVSLKNYKFDLVSNSRLITKKNELFGLLDINSTINELDYAQTVLKNPEELIKALNELLYTYNTAIRSFIKDFIKSWNKKLKDNKINSLNDYSVLFDDNSVNVSWLTESGTTT